jgi:iron complex transport system substrate-binding protein
VASRENPSRPDPANGPRARGFPRRIVCLTEETTETLYLLGEGDRVVGVSGYTMRPPEARRKPKVSAFIKARFDKILALEPDLVLAFSDLQADIVAELARRGLNVFCFNQRSVAEILDMVETLGRIAGAEERGRALRLRLERDLEDIAAAGRRLPFRPRVFFEEWNDPLISGIRWVDELIELAGGEPVFPELRAGRSAGERIVEPAAVIPRDPQVIIASWCGARVDKEAIRARPGWDAIAAVRAGHVYEISSTLILQPGPAALTDGVRELHRIIAAAASGGGRRSR